jgi:hypothetical protein
VSRFLVLNATWIEADTGPEANDRVAKALGPLKAEGTSGYGVAAPEGDEWAEEAYENLRVNYERRKGRDAR